MRELCIPLQKYLLRNPPSEDPEICSRVTSWEIVTTADLQVSLLHERRPYELWIPAVDHKKGP